MPRLAVSIVCLAVAVSLADAEEMICRYCTFQNRILPPGSELEGRYHYAPHRQVDVTHIKLDVTPDFEIKTVSGTASISATVIAKPVDVLRLDAVNLKIQSVSCEEADVEDYYSSRSDLQISFAEPLEAGTEFTIHVEYSAEPVMGLYFRTPDMGYLESDTHIWTQGETHEARHWFPCFDYPNEQSSTEIICHVPQDMTVLSNGMRMGQTTDDQGLKAVRWLQEKPHVNYLMCLVAGHLEKLEKRHRDVPLGFYSQPSLAKYAKNSFQDTSDIMAYFEKEIGMDFPWLKYDQVTIVDFTAGGMENTTLTTLTHNTIFSEATENLRTTRRLDAHEMAHQWFGDYVTCKDWSHLWLNEGFATYYTHLYEGHKLGRDAMLYGLYRDAENRILPQKNDTKAVVFNKYKNPMQQFDYRAYPKGSWVLHMLRSQLGADLYRKCIKSYLEKHAMTSVVSDDLRQVIEEHTGRPFDRFFDQWLYSPRHPALKISYRWMPKQKLARVTIAQTQKVDDVGRLFHFPTKLRFMVEDETIDHEIEVRKESEDFYVPLQTQPSIVRFDPEYSVLATVEFSKSDELLSAQIRNADDMMGRLLAAKALAKRKTKSGREWLGTALNEDEFFGIRVTAANSLSAHGSDEAFEILADSWQQKDARVRQAIVQQLAKRYHPDTRKLMEMVLTSEQNPAILAVATRALGGYSDHDARDLILEQLDSDSFKNEIAVAAISAIRAQRDQSFKEPLMKVLTERERDFTSRGFAEGLTTLGLIAKPLSKKADVRRFLLSYVNDKRDTIASGAIRALGNLGDARATAVVESFVDSPKPRVAAAAKNAVQELRKEKVAAPSEVVSLRQAIADVKKANTSLKKQIEDIQKQVESRVEPTKDKKSSKEDVSTKNRQSDS